MRRSADWIVAQPDRCGTAAGPRGAGSVAARTTRSATCRGPTGRWATARSGMLEGFSSTIRADGSQPMRYAVRNDCMREVAMLLALDAARQRPAGARPPIAANLLDYIFGNSAWPAVPRADPEEPVLRPGRLGAGSPGSYWGDDNARALFGMGAVAALAEGVALERAHRPLHAGQSPHHGRTVSASLCHRGEAAASTAGGRPTGPGGTSTTRRTMQSWLWACYLWAYEQTRFEPLLTRTETGMRMMIRPIRTAGTGHAQRHDRALAAAVAAGLAGPREDTPEHRRWLRHGRRRSDRPAGSPRARSAR